MKGTTNQTRVNKLLSWGERGVVILTVSIFILWNAGNLIFYKPDEYVLTDILAFGFLTLFIMMATANIVLFRMFKNLGDGQNYF